ncbi:26S proteasome non-ATPase regulatory subunit 10-like [Branchiostoma lanceolatum]|uniref:26S proteasome non-ATPase regulatory subunit 10-like n=1 Tax=Branchiostoma lanceolatum TaxID=7740 RepID=UPI00345538FE
MTSSGLPGREMKRKSGGGWRKEWTSMMKINGDTALHEACRGGHDKVAELLLKNGADLNVTDKVGYTALHRACKVGHDKVVELLIKNGADLNVTDWFGDTALHEACRRGQDKVAELLIKNGADVNVANKAENTALHKACGGGHDKVVELLIKNRADLNVTNWTETLKQEEYSELVSSVGSERGTTVKLFLCGDGQVGKTSLREILNKVEIYITRNHEKDNSENNRS